MPDGTVVVVAGQGGPVDSSEVYDPISGTWTYSGSLMTARSAQTANLLADGSLLIAGGYGEDGQAQPSHDRLPDFAGHKALKTVELGTVTGLEAGEK